MRVQQVIQIAPHGANDLLNAVPGASRRSARIRIDEPIEDRRRESLIEIDARHVRLPVPAKSPESDFREPLTS